MARKKITESLVPPLPPPEELSHPDEGDAEEPLYDVGEEDLKDTPSLPPPGVNNQPLPSKSEAIRQALADLGMHASVQQVQAWIKDHYNMEVAATNIYQAKNKLGGPKAATKPLTHTKSPLGDPMVSLSELTTIRDLGDKVGWDRLQQIIDILRPD